ncbi:DUF4384 domain-containing protein [Aestuariispira ectoiniformans]|uniref:DUF4384 domain-containing protein n=1 Tax=Aestuariispira ectoiniformans TaxID=2775080 RepID=UPI00223BF7DD|nr:DUF4384 domain-containing protein [Aestuariispira ectoiniformans]
MMRRLRGKYSACLSAALTGAALMALATAPAQATDSKRLLYKAAVDILLDVPEGSKIAIRPFFDNETDMPQAVADKIYNDLFDAFFKASHGAHVFVDRTNLLKIQRSREEFYEADMEELLAAARADIEIICTPTPHPRGVNLACNATDLHETTTLGRAQVVLAVDAAAAGVQPYELALSQLAESLSRRTPDMKRIEHIVIRDHNRGTQTDLGAWLGRQLATQVETQTAKTRQEALAAYDREKALSDAATPPPEANTVYRLTGTFYRLDKETAELLVALKADGQSVAKGSAKISIPSLPKDIAPTTGMRDKVYQAVGEAILSEKLDRDAALRAARNLARARVVAQALGLSGPAVDIIRSEADAASILAHSLNKGIPTEERFVELVSDADDKVTIELRARVIPIGSVIHPDIQAKLNKSTFKAMEPIYVDLSSSATTFIGLFSWGADNRVVRLYPSPQSPSLAVEPNAPLLLPEPGQGDILSMPLPGLQNPEDHEALIVVASTKPIDFTALAPMAGESLSETMTVSVDGSHFFNALARTDVSRIALEFLPYQVRR